MVTQEPPPNFKCDALYTENRCLCDNAPCHFPGNVQDCFLSKEKLKAAGHPRQMNEHSPHIASPPSIAVSREKLEKMMHRPPPKA